MRRPVSRVVLMALGILLAVFVGEIGLTIADVAPQHTLSGYGAWETQHDVFGFAYVPGVRFRYDGGFQDFGVPSSINAKGLREREYDYRKSVGIFRVLILGDSFTASLEVPLEQVWHEILEERFRETSSPIRGVEVIGAGIQGWSTDQQLLYYRHEGYKYDPDLVILQFYPNDLPGNGLEIARRPNVRARARDKPFFVLRGNELVLADPFRQERAEKEAKANRTLSGRLRNFLRSHSRTYRLARQVVLARTPERAEAFCYEAKEIPSELLPFASAYPPDYQAAWAVTARLVKELQREVTKDGRKFAVLYMPSRRQVLPQAWQETLRCWPQIARLKWELDKPNRLMGTLLGELGIPYLDLTPRLREFIARTGSVLYFARDVHLDPEGHQQVARLVYDWLVQQELIPR